MAPSESEIHSTRLSTKWPETVPAENQVQTELSNLRSSILQQSLLTESMQALIMSDSLPKEARYFCQSLINFNLDSGYAH